MRSWPRFASGAPRAAALALATALACDAIGGKEPEPALQAEAGAIGYAPPEPGSYRLPALGSAADGAVLDSDSEAHSLHELFDDRLVLLSFVYGSCNDAEGCPMATSTLYRTGQKLAREDALRDEVRMLTLSFDPERDTPEVMARYGEHLARATEGVDWRFLTTASREQLRPILDAYGQALSFDLDEAGEPLGTITHVLRVFLVDRERRIRNVYSTSFLEPEVLLADLETLLLEERGHREDDRDEARTPPARAALLGPGDARAGYEEASYRTRSVDFASRRGREADLAARVKAPPLGLPAVPLPRDAVTHEAAVALGRKLFFDRRLSHNDTISCAMCHIPEQGFASNEMATAIGIEGRSVRRNAPTLYNVAYLRHLFHDGRDTRLEHQIWGPLLAPNEMGNPSVGSVIEKVRALPGYAARFEAAFPGRGLSLETLGLALAAYERTLVSGDSPFDRWYYGGDESAVGAAEKRGFALFSGKAGCIGCHPIGRDTALFSDDAFHNTGIGYARSMGKTAETQRLQVAPGVYLEVDRSIVAQVAEPPQSDLGRYEITRDPADRWKYRTPTLRNVAKSAPYMHDGSLATLRDVVLFYDRGGIANEGLDARIRPLSLAGEEVRDLVAFLESLTGSDVPLLVADAFAAPVGDVGSPAQAGPIADRSAR